VLESCHGKQSEISSASQLWNVRGRSALSYDCRASRANVYRRRARAAEFRPSYKRAAPQQAALAIACFLCGVSLALLTQQWLWLLGGILVGAVVPFTLVFLMPTNRLLLDEVNQLDAQPLESLLAKWAGLYAVRTVSSVVGFLVLLWAYIFQA
jgi:hypothetical protein